MAFGYECVDEVIEFAASFESFEVFGDLFIRDLVPHSIFLVVFVLNVILDLFNRVFGIDVFLGEYGAKHFRPTIGQDSIELVLHEVFESGGEVSYALAGCC